MRTRLWTHVFLIVYLVIQLLLPLRGFMLNKYETHGAFSWNMYAYSYRCNIRYNVTTRDGRTRRINLHSRKIFRYRDGNKAIIHREVLPAFHHWLCTDLRPRMKLQTIYAYARCTLNMQPPAELIERDVELCSASHYGVIPR